VEELSRAVEELLVAAQPEALQRHSGALALLSGL